MRGFQDNQSGWGNFLKEHVKKAGAMIPQEASGRMPVKHHPYTGRAKEQERLAR
jgi:hypothetical protein